MRSPHRRLATLEAHARRNGQSPAPALAYHDPCADMTEEECTQYIAAILQILYAAGGEPLMQTVLEGLDLPPPNSPESS